MAFRVPTLNVSAVDLTIKLAKPATYQEICNAIREESEGSMKVSNINLYIGIYGIY